MELREFAERVLFATSLEEKLRTPDVMTDECPGAAVVTPTAPGRPRDLHFKPTGTARGEFPGARQLEQNQERGRLLHFFANHELLATELMALVLLKFPEAPAAFRKGVYETLKDEQEHTRLYIERMRGCGIEFGAIPVSGYFWRAVAGMESPMDYIAGLSLTFEQANLDFARHFSACFADVGDADSAKLLQRIYHDEIGHVAYGLKWFRRWKNPTESDWDAFCRQLKFPLSPARAKGFSINIEGRRAAGLPLDFIENLNVFSQSKGRTPTVFLFNPLAEARIAGGRSFSPTKHQAQLARDLANLPQFLGRQDDIVLVEHKPAVHFLSGLKAAGFALPEFVEAVASLRERKLGRLRPWAWGPDSVESLQPLFANLTGEPRTASGSFNPEIAQLYSKAWSAAFLQNFLRRVRAIDPHPTAPFEASDCSWLCTEDEVGVAVNTLTGALEAIAAIRGRGQHQIVIKQALGLAGGNAIRLFEPELLESHRRWMAKAVANGGQLVVEPWLERVQDFSVQLEMAPEGLRLCGYTGLITDGNGQFQGNWAAPKFERRLPPGVTSLFHTPPDIVAHLHALYTNLFTMLEVELRRVGFIGPVGIDAFVYRTPPGECRLKPVVEINPRYTMGRLTVELMKHVAPGSHGWFRLLSRKQAQTAGGADFESYARALARQFPLRLEGEPVLRIREGALCLNDPAAAQVVVATFQVSRTPLTKFGG
ncbi:MAG: DUF455 family protein [Verrucomicrobia subdivision 3 bacterium]|nr:DUF455 family protein [Verrucomicrobiota bacterium]MCC6820818.1 DUF455 family protein [Limisphaerales bacterium]